MMCGKIYICYIDNNNHEEAKSIFEQKNHFLHPNRKKDNFGKKFHSKNFEDVGKDIWMFWIQNCLLPKSFFKINDFCLKNENIDRNWQFYYLLVKSISSSTFFLIIVVDRLEAINIVFVYWKIFKVLSRYFSGKAKMPSFFKPRLKSK